MNCEQVKARIDDDRGEELEMLPRMDLEAHLRTCEPCQATMALVEKQGRAYRAYANSVEQVEMAPDLWMKIQQRVVEMPAPDRMRHGLIGRMRAAFSPGEELDWTHRLAYASPLVLVLAIATILAIEFNQWGQIKGRAGSPSVQGVSGVSAVSGPVERMRSGRNKVPESDSLQVALMAIQQAEKDYLSAINALAPTATKQTARLDPKMKGMIEQDLKQVDQSLAKTREAYRAHPQDVDLASYLLSLYATKLEVLQALIS